MNDATSKSGPRYHRGLDILHDPFRNQGTAFSAEQRDQLDLHGLLPPRITTIERQAQRILINFDKMPDNLLKYIYMTDLEDRNETLFYHVVMHNVEQMLPIIYTPTVGQACQQFGALFRRPRGLYVSAADRGRVAEILANWPYDDVRAIVITDGERILGLGDLGAQGMGIPVGKCALYTACGGIPPSQMLPIMLDVGTDNESLRRDPLYIGLPQERVQGDAYDELVEEFVTAANERFPGVLIQFEDFANRNAFPLLERYRGRVLAFNDDIQGTAGVALAGIFSALRITGTPLAEQTFLFLGAGEAGIGIADLIVQALVEEGIDEGEARRRCWLVDSRGLIVAGRERLNGEKERYAHEGRETMPFLAAIEALRPTAIIGVSGQGGTFTPEVIEAVSAVNERPIIFALSNPTANSECTAEEAYRHSGGRAVFASGSPFAPVVLDGQRFVPGQGNNVYVFPGIGFGAVTVGARHITDEMFLAAARRLAALVDEADLAVGRIYPALGRIREVSAAIATAVAVKAYEQGLATLPMPDDLSTYIREQMYDPHYVDIV